MPEISDILIDGVNITKLKKSVEYSVKQLEAPRSYRQNAIKEFVGLHYGVGATDGLNALATAAQTSRRRVPTNFIELATTIYSRMLAPKIPQVIVETDVPELKPMASEFTLALNQIPTEIEMRSIIQKTIVEALMSIGIVKVGLTATGQNVFGHDQGTPFVDVISLDDYFCDMTAKDYSHIEFEGNTYWMDLDKLKNDKSFPEHLKKDIELESDMNINVGDNGQERAEAIAREANSEMYKNKIRLRDVYVVNEKKLVTFDARTGAPLRCIPWDGPINGPYHRLAFSDVPGNLMPLPPVSTWMDLHELTNRLFRKLARQADAQKTVYGFSGDDDEAVAALAGASDGSGIRYQGQEPRQLKIGGVDQLNLAFFLNLQQQSNYYAGNVDSLGGLAQQTETVGQDKLLNEAANARLSTMLDSVYDFLRGIFKTLAWYEWTDVSRTRVLKRTLKDSDNYILINWTPDTRDGDFLDYNFDIDVFSMQDDSPQAKLSRIMSALNNVVIPLAPMIMEQGGFIDVAALMKQIAKYGDIPEIEEIVKMNQELNGSTDPSKQQYGNESPTRMPVTTTRNYNRTSTPGATKRGQADVLMRSLMGTGVQDSEIASLDRSPS